MLFRDLNVVLHHGETLAITGINGSGKSTLLQILCGLITPVEGEVRYKGEVLAPAARALKIGFAAPYLNLYDGFSARENLEFIAQVRRLRHAGDRISELLSSVGLEGREDDRLATYSSGMRQRVRFAAALIHRPEVLLLDEPGVTLDEDGREVLSGIIRNHCQQDGAVVIATNMESEANLCDLRIELGKLRAVETFDAQQPG